MTRLAPLGRSWAPLGPNLAPKGGPRVPKWSPKSVKNRCRNRCKNQYRKSIEKDAKSGSKMSPKSNPKAPPEAFTRLKLSIQDGAFFKIKFQLKFERFGDPKMAPKITQNPLWRQLGAPGGLRGLRGLRGPSGGLPEAFGERFSSQECYKTS